MNMLNNNIYDNLELLPMDLQGWNGDKPIFKELINYTKPSVIVEIGTWKGLSAINMAKICKELGLDTKIYCIDTWLGSLEFWYGLNDTKERDLMLKNGYPNIYYQFLSNVVHSGLQEYIIPVPLPSSIGIKLLSKLGIRADLVYIDGSHEYNDVYNDINDSFYILEKDGIVFGDDYETFKDVKTAVNDITGKYELSFDVIKNNFWVIK